MNHLNVVVPCARAAAGCMWEGARKAHRHHEGTCGFVADECPRCHEPMLRWQIGQHAPQCARRNTRCEHCTRVVQLHMLEAHIKECTSVPVTCACGANMTRGELAAHAAQACPQREVCCGNEMLGCTFRGVSDTVVRHEASGCPFGTHAVPDWFPAVRDKLLAVLAENEQLRATVTRLSGPEGQAIAKLTALHGLLRGGDASAPLLWDVRKRVARCRREWLVDELGLRDAATLADSIANDIEDMLASQPGVLVPYEDGGDAFAGVFHTLRNEVGADALRVEANVAWEGGHGDALVNATASDGSTQNYTVHSIQPRPAVTVSLVGARVSPTHITLRSDSWGQTWYLTGFVLEGALCGSGPSKGSDGEPVEWIELLHVVSDRVSLHGVMKVHTWAVNDVGGMYDTFRLRQTENDAAGSSYLYLSGMELFGTLEM